MTKFKNKNRSKNSKLFNNKNVKMESKSIIPETSSSKGKSKKSSVPFNNDKISKKIERPIDKVSTKIENKVIYSKKVTRSTSIEDKISLISVPKYNMEKLDLKLMKQILTKQTDSSSIDKSKSEEKTDIDLIKQTNLPPIDNPRSSEELDLVLMEQILKKQTNLPSIDNPRSSEELDLKLMEQILKKQTNLPSIDNPRSAEELDLELMEQTLKKQSSLLPIHNPRSAEELDLEVMKKILDKQSSSEETESSLSKSQDSQTGSKKSSSSGSKRRRRHKRSSSKKSSSEDVDSSSKRRSSKPPTVEEKSCGPEFFNQPHSIFDDISSDTGKLIPNKVLQSVNQYKNEIENSSQRSKLHFMKVEINDKILYFGKKVSTNELYPEEEIFYLGTCTQEPTEYEIEIAKNYLLS